VFGRLEPAAAAEHGQASEQPLLLVVQQLVTPFDRGPQRLLARVDAAAGPEQVEAPREALEQLLRREHAHARRRQLQRER
jgi:hypothetical protein